MSNSISSAPQILKTCQAPWQIGYIDRTRKSTYAWLFRSRSLIFMFHKIFVSLLFKFFFRVIAPFRRRGPLLSSVLLVLKCLSRVALDALKSSNFFIHCRKLHAQKNKNYKALRNPFYFRGGWRQVHWRTFQNKIKTRGYHFRSIQKNRKSYRVTKVIVQGLQQCHSRS